MLCADFFFFQLQKHIYEYIKRGCKGLSKKKGLKKYITQRFDLAPEAVGCVRLTAVDNTNLYIENHKSVSEYTSKRVAVSTGSFYIVVEGVGLELESFGRENVAVRGEITSIRYEALRKG
jgi:sporulation protein YqfC